MKPLFCIPPREVGGSFAGEMDGSYAGEILVVSAQKELLCWSERHLTYCTISLFGLGIFLPSATLTSAVKFSDTEDVRFVYLYLRMELLLKGVMIFAALSTQQNETVALSCLCVGSMTITIVCYLMQPSNHKHVNRIKYLCHACAIWMALTCIWVVESDNKDWKMHAALVGLGWGAFFCLHIASEVNGRASDIMRREADDDTVQKCAMEMDKLQQLISSGNTIAWTTHSYVLRLLDFAQHKHVPISKKSFETLALLSYLDQMTQEDAFFAFAPSTCMEIFCNALAYGDANVQSFAIRTLKTFLQEQRYVTEMALLLSDRSDRDIKTASAPQIQGMQVAQPVADVVKNAGQLGPKLDAGICLLALCGIDSNQLRWAVPLLPTLNQWMRSGPVVSQHLALEILANISSRFDLSEFIVTSDCLPAIFELFEAIDQGTGNQLAVNEENGFRKGFAQPASLTSLAHQLPRAVIENFSSQFSTVKGFLDEMSGDATSEEAPVSIWIEDFLAWMESGNFLSEKIKAKLVVNEINLKSDEPVEPLSKGQYELLFALIDDDGSGDLDEDEIAEFLETQGLGERSEISQILLDTGLRQRGISEMKEVDEEIVPDQFRGWLRTGATKDGLARRMITHMFGADMTDEALTDEMIDGLFGEIDDDAGGSLDADEIASFLEEKGLGDKDDLEDILKGEMVGRSVTDTVVQLSAKHIHIMKTEMIRFVLHIIMESAGGMSGLGRQKMIENGVVDIILRSVREGNDDVLRVTALQGLHALVSDGAPYPDPVSLHRTRILLFCYRESV